MRGATNPNETLGAQQLKAQWGSLSVQQMQAEVGRFARDLFRMKAEVIGNKFSMDTLRLMTGLPIPDQPLRDAARARVAAGPAAPPAPGSLPAPAPPISAEDVQLAEQPSAQEVEALLRQDVVRRYRIDIESDSTVRGDLARNQQQMATFLTGTAQFMQAIGPAVREHAIPADTALEIYAAFARQFKLGKQAEDALDRLADTMRKAAEKPAPPDPAAIKAQAQAQLAAQTLQLREKEAQIKEHGMLLEHQLDATRTQGELARIGAETQTELLKARLAHPPAPPPQDAGRPQ
jgi:hypothetical protein